MLQLHTLRGLPEVLRLLAPRVLLVGSILFWLRLLWLLRVVLLLRRCLRRGLQKRIVGRGRGDWLHRRVPVRSRLNGKGYLWSRLGV